MRVTGIDRLDTPLAVIYGSNMLEVEAPLLGETFFSQNATSSLSESAKAFQDLETYTLPDIVFTLRSYFYLWLPSQTMFKSLEEVPNIFVRVSMFKVD